MSRYMAGEAEREFPRDAAATRVAVREIDARLADILHGRAPFDYCICYTLAGKDISPRAWSLWKHIIAERTKNGTHPAAPGMRWRGGVYLEAHGGFTPRRRMFIIALRHWLRAVYKEQA